MFKRAAATIPLGPRPNSFASETPPDYSGAPMFLQGYPAHWGAMDLPVFPHVGNRVFAAPYTPGAFPTVKGQRFYTPSLNSWNDWTGNNLAGDNLSPLFGEG